MATSTISPSSSPGISSFEVNFTDGRWEINFRVGVVDGHGQYIQYSADQIRKLDNSSAHKQI